MKNITTLCLIICLMFALAACSPKESGEVRSNTEAYEEQTASADSEVIETVGNDETEGSGETEGNGETERSGETEENFTRDCSSDMKAELEQAAAGSASLQNEMERVEAMAQKYDQALREAQTQADMNQASMQGYTIWDMELNSLWGRFSDSADRQTKENVLADQRNWIDMKDEAVLESIGTREENGSMYSLLVNSFMEEITRDRAYILANELAKIKGESFVMPEKSKYGLFADNQGTGRMCSFLMTRQGESGDDEAVVSLDGAGRITGTFVDSANGELSFTSSDADGGIVKGIIKINGWDGAGFTVTEAPEGYAIPAGEEFDFPFAF